MDRFKLISGISILIVAVVLWSAYNFYIDYTFERTCEDLKTAFEGSVESIESAQVKSILEQMKDSGECNVFKYLVKVDQANLLITTEKDKVRALESEIAQQEDSLKRIEHVAISKTCDAEGVLEKYEKDYCAALHEENYRLIKLIERSSLRSAYKATLINCLSECINAELSCAQACWERKVI